MATLSQGYEPFQLLLDARDCTYRADADGAGAALYLYQVCRDEGMDEPMASLDGRLCRGDAFAAHLELQVAALRESFDLFV